MLAEIVRRWESLENLWGLVERGQNRDGESKNGPPRRRPVAGRTGSPPWVNTSGCGRRAMPFLRASGVGAPDETFTGGLLPNPEALDGPLRYLSPRGRCRRGSKDVGPPRTYSGGKMSRGREGLVDIPRGCFKAGCRVSYGRSAAIRAGGCDGPRRPRRDGGACGESGPRAPKNWRSSAYSSRRRAEYLRRSQVKHGQICFSRARPPSGAARFNGTR